MISDLDPNRQGCPVALRISVVLRCGTMSIRSTVRTPERLGMSHGTTVLRELVLDTSSCRYPYDGEIVLLLSLQEHEYDHTR